MISPGELARRRALAKKIIRQLKKLLPNAKIALHYHTPWELLVAVELSAQCTDKKVNEITEKLFKKYRTLDDYVRARRPAFEKDVHACGFYRNKTKNILAAAKMVKKDFGGRLPKTMEEMITIPGVARKTANVILGTIYGVVEGIAVDTHVRRLTRLWGLTKQTDPVKIERELMEIIPKKEWGTFSYLVIDYGRQYCPARPHDHATCPIRTHPWPLSLSKERGR